MIRPRDPCPECDELGIVEPLAMVEQEVAVLEQVEPVLIKGQAHWHDEVNEYLYVYRCSLGHEIRDQRTGRPCSSCSWLPPELAKPKEVEELADLGIFVAWDPTEV